MKYFNTLFILVLLSHFTSAQNLSIPEPEFSGTMLLVLDSVSFETLEKQKSYAGSKANVGAAMFGVAKGKGMNLVNGHSSPIRVERAEIHQFIIKVKENDRDPVEVVNVFRMEQDLNKDKRVVIVGTVNFNKSTSAEIEFLPFKGSKYGESSYLLEIPNLLPGEYAITLDGSRDVFNLFGID